MALFVGRLPADIRHRELEDLFEKYGRLYRCSLKAGFAFVEFEDRRDAADAIKALDGHRLSGRSIVVEWSKDKKDRASKGDGDRDACFKCGEKGHWARDCSNRSKPQMEKVEQKFDYIVVLDFEATCDEKKNFGPQEIIEFPSVLINTRTYQVESDIQLYVKPVAQPQLTKFCTELTGITQDKVNKGESFLPSFEKYQAWLKENKLFDKKWTFLTCGDWDLLRMLPAQTKLSGIRIPKEFKSWINIKKVFSSFYNRNAAGMAGMLNILGMKLEGRHHSGIDDCKNIARIAIQMMKDGVVFDYTEAPKSEAGGNDAPVSNLPWVEVGKGKFCLLPRPNKKKIGELKIEGCEVLVTMMTDAEGANTFKQGCELSMIEWVHLPMPAKSLPSPMDKDWFKTRVAELAKMLNEGQKIVFHCDDGITRSAVIVYAVLRSLGKDAAKAEELIVKSRAPAAKGLTFTARQWADEIAGVSK